MHKVLEEKIDIIEYLNRLIKPENEISIDIPSEYSPESKKEILNILLDWCFLNSEEEYACVSTSLISGSGSIRPGGLCLTSSTNARRSVMS